MLKLLSYSVRLSIFGFACLELKLIIELDGGEHAFRINYDDQRSLFLEQRGFKVIRFWINEVIENTKGVLEAISLAILEIIDRAELFILFTLTQPSRSGEGKFCVCLKCVHRLARKEKELF